MIFACANCDPRSPTAPLCVDGDSYGWDANETELSITGKCSCICHKGSASVVALPIPPDDAPGAHKAIDEEYEALCAHAQDERELVGAGRRAA